MPAPIVVEVYAPQPRPQELAVLIAACTRAASPNECVTSESRTPDSPLGVAIVRRDGDRARIELGLRGVASAEWSTRDLVFQPGDDELERYRAIGFAIGTLVARQAEPPEASTEPDSPPPVEPAAPPLTPPKAATVVPPTAAVTAPARPRPRTRSTWIDMCGGIGLGLIPGAPRTGASLRAASEIVPAGTFAAAETGYSERIGDDSLRVRWLSLAVGIGHPLLPAHGSLGVDARLLLAFERLSLTAVEGAESDGASSWKPGVSAAVDAHWEAAAPLGVLVGAAAHLDPKQSVIRTRGTQVGQTPALGFSGFVGVRLKLR